MNEIKKFIKSFSKNNLVAAKVIEQIHQVGGTVIVVGGTVRDLFLGVQAKDLDVEVYGLEPQQLEQVLRKFGPVRLMGKSFGVFCLDGLDIDWSLPRSDSGGRKPKVTIDPNMNFVDAFRRRDLTVNAMGINLKTGELIDPFDGQTDLKNKVLRYVDQKLFTEDPLRFYRVMQFVGRFEMQPDDSLNQLCSKMDISTVSKERIEQEFTKLLLKSKSPSLGIQWLQDVGRLQEVLPELHAAIGVEQNFEWHPEGDVFKHLKQVVDAAARQSYVDNAEQIIIMWAALCHDLGKVTTTKIVDGRIRSIGHAQAGVAIAKKLLKRVTDNKNLVSAVCKLVHCHMDPIQFIVNNAGAVAYKKLAIKLYPQTIATLVKLALADWTGRKPIGELVPDKVNFMQQPKLQEFIKNAQAAGVWQNIEAPVLQGKDLLDVVKPGPKLGKLLNEAYLIQLQESLLDKDLLKKRVVNKDKSLKNS
jgi:tRNA nucleotidyltransferase (CCA-adding enzyme)